MKIAVSEMYVVCQQVLDQLGSKAFKSHLTDRGWRAYHTKREAESIDVRVLDGGVSVEINDSYIYMEGEEAIQKVLQVLLRAWLATCTGGESLHAKGVLALEALNLDVHEEELFPRALMETAIDAGWGKRAYPSMAGDNIMKTPDGVEMCLSHYKPEGAAQPEFLLEITSVEYRLTVRTWPCRSPYLRWMLWRIMKHIQVI